MVFICILLMIFAAVMTAMYVIQKRHLKKLNEDLEEVLTKGSCRRILLSAQDKEMERLLVMLNRYIEACQNEKAAYETRDKEFKHQISNISHDLRTPLTSILGYVQLIEREYAAGNEDNVKEYLGIIERKAEMLKNLISQFYDLSRLEGSEYEFQMEAVDLNVLISQTMADYYDEFEKNHFRVDIAIENSTMPALCDAKAMSRVYANLIQNVLKHGKDFVSIHMYKKDQSIITEIANGSESIDPGELAHLFDRFYTMDKMRTGQNTGLGLAIVKQFVEQMHGKIEAVYEHGLLKMRIEMKAA